MSKSAGDGLAVLETPAAKYRLSKLVGDGEIARVYRAEVEGKIKAAPVAIKVPKKPVQNALVLHEQEVLEEVKHAALPVLSDRFELEDGRVASVFEFVDGLDLQELRSMAAYRHGIQPHFHIGWFLERLLGVLGALHKKMVIHGNLQPKHLLIKRMSSTVLDHAVILIDFCWARYNPTEFDRIKIFTHHYSAPEIKRGAPPLPGMDIYSLGKCAVYLLGGDPKSGEMPRSVDPKIVAFIEKMIEPNYLKRPRDAWDLAREVLTLRREVYGPARWVELEA